MDKIEAIKMMTEKQIEVLAEMTRTMEKIYEYLKKHDTARGLTLHAPEISTQEAIDKITDYLVDLEAHKHGIEISDVKRFLREQIFR